jgi:hypothetical protein
MGPQLQHSQMTNAVVEKDNAKRRVDVQRELHERRDK